MEGAARGAHEANGVAIGIIPTDDPHDANEYIDYVIPSGMGEMRNCLIIRMADVVVAFPGKYGTLSEMALTLQAGKPLISVSAWNLGDDVIQAQSPIEAARKAMELAGGK